MVMCFYIYCCIVVALYELCNIMRTAENKYLVTANSYVTCSSQLTQKIFHCRCASIFPHQKIVLLRIHFQFVTSPLCCPSRSSILTGKYIHNHHAINNSVEGNCANTHWQQGPEKYSIATYLKGLNYTTIFAGKYLNQYGFPDTGGPQRVPPGWDRWYGLIGNSKYYNYTLSVNGKPERHGTDYEKDYFTDVIVSTRT